jgi:macrolide-specific efflux system membrane fusion protein
MAVEKSQQAASSATDIVASGKTTLWIIVFAIAAALLLWYGNRRAAAVVASPTAPMQTVQARQGDIDQIVSAVGNVQLYKFADVGAQLPGVISIVHVALGDEVKAGKLLLSFAPISSEAQFERDQAQLAQLRAELTEQQAQYDFAELQFKRQTQLKADNATREDAFEASRTAMSTASARLDAINARIRQAESTVKFSEEASKHTELTAPNSGTVVLLSAHPGQMVAGPQTVLARIADLSSMTVQARVAEVDIAHVHRGMSAYFSTPAYPGKRWYGKISQISPVPAEGSGAQGQATFYNVMFEVANPDRQLLSGMTAQVSIVTEHVRDATLLPIDSLGKADADGTYNIKVLGANRQMQQRKLRLGLRSGSQAQVLSGLAPGEAMVTHADESATGALTTKPVLK